MSVLEALNETVAPGTVLDVDDVTTGTVGAPTTVMDRDAMADPPVSVTVRMTLYVPIAE